MDLEINLITDLWVRKFKMIKKLKIKKKEYQQQKEIQAQLLKK